MKRLERRLRALEQRHLPEVLPPFIVQCTVDEPRPLEPGERLVVDYNDDHGLIVWKYRIATDPDDNGVHKDTPGGYVAECLRLRAAGKPSWPLPWDEATVEHWLERAKESSPTAAWKREYTWRRRR